MLAVKAFIAECTDIPVVVNIPQARRTKFYDCIWFSMLNMILSG